MRFFPRQALRGDTYFFIVLDEFCFLRPKVLLEVVPMTLTGGHMVFASSHRVANGAKKKPFLNMAKMHADEIIINDVSHVCPEHVYSMINGDITAMCCVCNLFGQSPHIKANASYRKMLNTLLKHSGGNGSSTGDDDGADTMRTAMFSEMGVMLPEVTDAAALDESAYKLGTIQLAAENAFNEYVFKPRCPIRKFTNPPPADGAALPDIYERYGENLEVSNVAVCYIDPTQMDVGRSFHGLVVVTRAERRDYVDEVTSGPRYHYVVLAVEEFDTQSVAGNSLDSQEAMATMFMATCRKLTEIYEGHFNTIVVAPESNNASVDRFWRLCGRRLARDTVLREYNVQILAATVENTRVTRQYTPEQRAAVRRAAHRRKQREKVAPYLPSRNVVGAAASSLPSYAHRRGSFGVCANDAGGLADVARALKEDREYAQEMHAARSYRVGYVLDREKTDRTRAFYTGTYNPGRKNVCDLMCAYDVWSYWLVRRGLCPAYYLAEKLDGLQLSVRYSATTGKRSWTVSGKRRAKRGQGTNGGDHAADDVAVAAVMSVSLCMDLHHNRFSKRLVRLEPATLTADLDRSEDVEAIINDGQGGRAFYDEMSDCESEDEQLE